MEKVDPILCELTFFLSRTIKLFHQYRVLSLPIALLYSSESNGNRDGIQIVIMKLKRRVNRKNLLFFFFFLLFLLLILKVITRLQRCEHLYNLCKTPSAGSIFCKPAGLEYKTNRFSKTDVCCTIPLLKCQASLWCCRSSVSKKLKGKWQTSRKRFYFIHSPLSYSLFANALEPSSISGSVGPSRYLIKNISSNDLQIRTNQITMNG